MRVRHLPYLATNWISGEPIFCPHHQGLSELEFETMLTVQGQLVYVLLGQLTSLVSDERQTRGLDG